MDVPIVSLSKETCVRQCQPSVSPSRLISFQRNEPFLSYRSLSEYHNLALGPLHCLRINFNEGRSELRKCHRVGRISFRSEPCSRTWQQRQKVAWASSHVRPSTHTVVFTFIKQYTRNDTLSSNALTALPTNPKRLKTPRLSDLSAGHVRTCPVIVYVHQWLRAVTSRNCPPNIQHMPTVMTPISATSEGTIFFVRKERSPHLLCMYVDVYVQVCMHLIRISYIFIFPIRYFLFIKNYRNTTSVWNICYYIRERKFHTKI